MRDGSGWGEVRLEVRGQRSEVSLKRFLHLCNLTSDLCNRDYSGTHSADAKNATIDLTVATP